MWTLMLINMRPVQRVSSHIIWKIRDIYWRRYQIQETLYIGQWCLNPLQCRHLGTSCGFPNHHQLLCLIFLNHWQSEISSISEVILVLGTARSYRAPHLGCWGLSHLGDLMFHQNTRPETRCLSRCLIMIKLRSPFALSSCFLNHLNSFHGGMLKFNAKFDAVSLLYLPCHFECDGHTVHMLTQQCQLLLVTSTVKLSLFMHVHSIPLSLAARLHQCCANHSCYINSGWIFSGQTLYPIMI